MKKYNSLTLLFLLGLASCLTVLGCASESSATTSRVDTLPYYQDASFTPHWLAPGSEELQGFHQIPDFQFTNQEGQAVSRQTFAGKIYVTDFFFTTCPGICPKMTSNMSILQESFLDDADVLFLSHSVTPGEDSVPVLLDYAERNGVVNGKWHLLTGSREEIYRMGRKAYFVEEDLGTNQEPDAFLHTENFVLIDPQGYIRGIYNGLNQSSIAQLDADIRTLQQENEDSNPS